MSEAFLGTKLTMTWAPAATRSSCGGERCRTCTSSPTSTAGSPSSPTTGCRPCTPGRWPTSAGSRHHHGAPGRGQQEPQDPGERAAADAGRRAWPGRPGRRGGRAASWAIWRALPLPSICVASTLSTAPPPPCP